LVGCKGERRRRQECFVYSPSLSSPAHCSNQQPKRPSRTNALQAQSNCRKNKGLPHDAMRCDALFQVWHRCKTRQTANGKRKRKGGGGRLLLTLGPHAPQTPAARRPGNRATARPQSAGGAAAQQRRHKKTGLNQSITLHPTAKLTPPEPPTCAASKPRHQTNLEITQYHCLSEEPPNAASTRIFAQIADRDTLYSYQTRPNQTYSKQRRASPRKMPLCPYTLPSNISIHSPINPPLNLSHPAINPPSQPDQLVLSAQVLSKYTPLSVCPHQTKPPRSIPLLYRRHTCKTKQKPRSKKRKARATVRRISSEVSAKRKGKSKKTVESVSMCVSIRQDHPSPSPNTTNHAKAKLRSRQTAPS
jgi:hypothetical protein